MTRAGSTSVEGPSQFFGRWGKHPDVLAAFARHHNTGEPIPDSMANALRGLESMNAAFRGFVWSQVLRDDLMSRFEREGLTSMAVGMAYRRAILERPWTLDPLDGVTAFLGRPWSVDPFFARMEAADPQP